VSRKVGIWKVLGWGWDNKFKVQTSAGKVMASVFWDSEGILLVGFLKRGASLNSEQYVQTLEKLEEGIRWVQPCRKMNEVLVLPTVLI
jgi:hypothetical protein